MYVEEFGDLSTNDNSLFCMVGVVIRTMAACSQVDLDDFVDSSIGDNSKILTNLFDSLEKVKEKLLNQVWSNNFIVLLRFF